MRLCPKFVLIGSIYNTLINTEDLIVSRVILRLFQGIRSIMSYLEKVISGGITELSRPGFSKT